MHHEKEIMLFGSLRRNVINFQNMNEVAQRVFCEIIGDNDVNFYFHEAAG